MLTQPESELSWMILVASFSEHCIAGFCMYAIGLFHISILDQFHESVTLTSWLSSIFLCLLSSAEHCIAGFCMYAIGLFHISILEQFHESVTLTSWLSSIFLCLLSSAEHCIPGFCMYAIGLFHISILEQFHASVTLTSWLSSIFLCLLSSAGLLASVMIDRWNCRITMITGSLLVTIGLIVTAFSRTIIVVLIFYSVIAGVGVGLIYNSGYIVLAFNFEKKRNMATGIAVSGCGIGPFILSPLFQLIHQHYGYNGFFLMIAGLGLQACVCGALLRPSHLETTSKLARRNRKTENCFSCDLTVVKNTSLFCVGMSGFFLNLGIFIIYLHFPKYAMDNGSSESEVSLYLSIAGMCSCIGRILLGMASNSDNVNEDIVYFGSYVMIGVCTIIIPLFISFHSAKILYVIVLGSYSGACYVVINTIVLKLTGPNHVAQGTGLVMGYIGIGTLIGPPIAGVIVDNGGTYAMSFMVAGISLIIGGLLELCNILFIKEQYYKPATGDFVIEVTNGTKVMEAETLDETDNCKAIFVLDS